MVDAPRLISSDAMRIALAGALVAGCGRIDFDPLGIDAGSPNDVVELAVGGKASCARLRSGDIWCWGNNTNGLLGVGIPDPFSPSPLHVPTPGPTIDLDLDDDGGCARLATGGLIGWGFNSHGQLGVGDFGIHFTPVITSAADVIGLTMGGGVMCILHADETVACTGEGDEGELGDGTTGDRAAFGDVPGLTGVHALTSGSAHVCALLDSGATRCWGRNTFGQLGDGSMTQRSMPVDGPVGPYTAIGAGDDFTCGLRADRGVDCWGNNMGDQLGDTGVARSMAVSIAGISGATAIAVGADHVCALLGDRTVACWGEDVHGELGDAPGGPSPTPRMIPLADVVEISSRTDVSTCARTGDGAVWCWGDDLYGEIGDGTSGGLSAPPARVVGLPE